MNFDLVFERVIGHEGGYQCDFEDRGNWTGGKVYEGELKGTKFGLAAMTYPDLDIENLTIEQAKQIYLRDWWQPLMLDRMPKGMPYQLFDAAINHGSGRAAKFLQRAAGARDDGQIGPKTIAAVLAMDHNDLLMRFIAERLGYFTNIKLWETYGKGWVRRMAGNLQFAAQDN
ncbi:MAG TPA: secretion activator protein [Gammaproteobacteria bacterium]|nr:secretion activator protein [Gammaproteobacteria bacterium]